MVGIPSLTQTAGMRGVSELASKCFARLYIWAYAAKKERKEKQKKRERQREFKDREKKRGGREELKKQRATLAEVREAENH
jgi:hypothetical protein